MIYDKPHLRTRSSFWTIRIMTVISAFISSTWMAFHCLPFTVSPDSDLYTINYHRMFGVDTTVLLAGENQIDRRGPGPPGKSVPWLWLEPDFFHIFIQASLVLILLRIHCWVSHANKGLTERVTQWRCVIWCLSQLRPCSAGWVLSSACMGPDDRSNNR